MNKLWPNILRTERSKNLVMLFASVITLNILAIPFCMGSTIDATAIDPTAPPLVDESADHWSYSHTPMFMRVGLAMGMEAGGPIRYNTRFPEVKPDPHPTSYYHAPSFISIEVEYALTYGAVLLGGISRRDLAHRGINTRTVSQVGEDWRVDSFEFSDSGVMLGWVFGSRFQEAWWSADFTGIYDRGGIDVLMTRPSVATISHQGQVNISALSFRARASFGLYGAGTFQIGAGPEIHLPVWSRLSDQSDLELRPWIAKTVDLKASAALGIAVMSSIRF